MGNNAALQKHPLEDLQNASAALVNAILSDTFIVAAVEAVKQTKDKNGDPIAILTVFAQTLIRRAVPIVI